MSSSDDDRPLAKTHKANGVSNGTLFSLCYVFGFNNGSGVNSAIRLL